MREPDYAQFPPKNSHQKSQHLAIYHLIPITKSAIEQFEKCICKSPRFHRSRVEEERRKCLYLIKVSLRLRVLGGICIEHAKGDSELLRTEQSLIFCLDIEHMKSFKMSAMNR